MQTTIGQGNTLVSPLHMCMIAGAICNDGNLMRPYLVDHTENASGALVEQNKPASYKQIMSKDQAAFLQNLMAAVVSDGTGAKLSDQSYEAFGRPELPRYQILQIRPMPGLWAMEKRTATMIWQSQ